MNLVVRAKFGSEFPGLQNVEEFFDIMEVWSTFSNEDFDTRGRIKGVAGIYGVSGKVEFFRKMFNLVAFKLGRNGF